MSWFRISTYLIISVAMMLGCQRGAQIGKTTPGQSRETPPASAAPANIAFPKVSASKTANGLEVYAIQASTLPVVQFELIVKSGAESDPRTQPGLAKLVASMLREGTATRSGVEIADQIEYLGADLWTSADGENIRIGVQGLSEHFEALLEILADVVINPAFDKNELGKLKRRELDRLALAQKDPRYLARRTFLKTLYGRHPYSRIDTTPQSIQKTRPSDLRSWHKKHVSTTNSLLVVAGNIEAQKVTPAVERSFAKLRRGHKLKPRYPKPPHATKRRIVVVDRPGSVQSVIYIGNLAIPRSHPDWIPLSVANQVLGGSAASRLFMDLREKRSLTYGAYSGVGARVDVGPFSATASVRTEVTVQAIEAFFEHLERIVKEPAPADELEDAKRYLGDSFPLKIDTPRKIANLFADTQLFELPEGYWDTFRTAIQKVDAQDALHKARKHIRPERALVVIVGQAADFAEALTGFGRVEVISPDGKHKATLRAKERATK